MSSQFTQVEKLERDLTPLSDVLASTPLTRPLYNALLAVMLDLHDLSPCDDQGKLYVENMSLVRPTLLHVFAALLPANRTLAQCFLQDLYLLLASNPTNLDILVNLDNWELALLHFISFDRNTHTLSLLLVHFSPLLPLPVPSLPFFTLILSSSHIFCSRLLLVCKQHK
jgi:hypothetical protein